MKINKIYLSVIFILFISKIYAQPPGYKFDIRIGKPILSSSFTKIKFAPNQSIYLIDDSRKIVQKIDLKGNVLKQWGGFGFTDGKFSSLNNLVIDANSNVYVLDNGRGLVHKFDNNGVFIEQWNIGKDYLDIYFKSDVIYMMDYSGVTKFSTSGIKLSSVSISYKSTPHDFCVDGNGDIYVSQTYEPTKYNGSTGNRIKDFGYWTFSGPGVIDVDAKNLVYVRDNFNDCINVYSQTSSNFVNKIGSNGYKDGQFQGLGNFTFDSNGDLYISDIDFYEKKIQKLTASGTFVSKFAYKDFATNEYIYRPLSVAVDSKGFIYVADLNNYIHKFSSDGSFILQWGGTGKTQNTFSYISAICIDLNDNVLIADATNKLIKKFDVNGNFISEFNGYVQGKTYGFSQLNNMIIDKSNNLYVLDNDQVIKYNSKNEFIRSWGQNGYGEGKFIRAANIIVTDSNYVYITDSGYLNQFDTAGTFIKRNYGGNSAKLVALDSNNFLFLNSANIYGYDGNFNLKSNWYWAKINGAGNEEFLSISNIYKDPKSNKLFLVDIDNNAIQVLTKEGINGLDKYTTADIGLNVFPNPSNGNFTVTSKFPIVMNKITNMFGQTEEHFSNTLFTKFKGLLILESFTADNKVQRVKILVE